MDHKSTYLSKKRTPQDAVALVKDNSSVFLNCEPMALMTALKDQKDRFSRLYSHTMLSLRSTEAQEVMLSPEVDRRFFNVVCYYGKAEGETAKRGSPVEQVICSFSQYESYIERIKPEYLLANVSPMDGEGYFSLGYAPNGRVAIDAGAKVILQVNNHMPFITSDYYKVHISEVAALCESDHPVMEFFDAKPSKIDEEVASHIIERIPDGATIQLGIGGLPSAIGVFLKDHKDLGIHTEMFSDTMTRLMKQGVVNNSKKKLYPGVSVSSFFQGSKETNDFIHNNKDVLNKKLAWANDSEIIAQNNDMISINSCLAVDLRGQVCSESLGFNTSGGAGGQLDFARGARKSSGGKSFIAMHSVAEKKNGDRISKISLALPLGSIVTTPRTDVQYIVTEYGVAEMENRTVSERALNLIAIAHPDYREQLRFEAKQNGYI